MPVSLAVAPTLVTLAPLPACRTTPSPPFQLWELTSPGPLLYKHGHTRKPVIVKACVCIFVCMAVKSVHLELVANLTTELFLACFKRFAARRGFPTTVYSDNGTNFVRAQRELKAAFNLLQDHLLSGSRHRLGVSPGCAPHFGGLWESAAKLMKGLLHKVVGTRRLSFEELTTVLTEIGGILNSRPLIPIDSTPDDGIPAWTPGHFLVGRPLIAPPSMLCSLTNLLG